MNLHLIMEEFVYLNDPRSSAVEGYLLQLESLKADWSWGMGPTKSNTEH